MRMETWSIRVFVVKIFETAGGVPANNVKAYMWWSIAKAQGHKKAGTSLDALKEHVTPAEIAKAQNLAAEWWEEHND